MITQFIVVELWIVGQWAKGGENRSKNFRCLRANFVRSINRSIVAFIIWTSLKFVLVESWNNLSGLLRSKTTGFIWSLLNINIKKLSSTIHIYCGRPRKPNRNDHLAVISYNNSYNVVKRVILYLYNHFNNSW